jgi:ABC-2 type transport system ATP-binding protein
MNAPANDNVITIDSLTRKFGSKEVLGGVSLEVPKGCVFGLVGPNGAGKSTLIKHILGLLRAESGSVRVFGTDPVSDPVSVLARIGYLSEEPDLPGWMRVGELLRYTEAFYPNWDPGYAESLRIQFGLDLNARVKTLSKGQLAKAALLTAQAHRPDLLLLDEPSSGLDPIVRNDILAAIIRTVADEGRTVFFSSHLLDEIERVSDHVAMLYQGKLVLCGQLDSIKEQHRHFTLRSENGAQHMAHVAGLYQVKGNGRERAVICNLARKPFQALLADCGGTVVADRPATLDEIFVLHAGAPLTAQEPAHD